MQFVNRETDRRSSRSACGSGGSVTGDSTHQAHRPKGDRAFEDRFQPSDRGAACLSSLSGLQNFHHVLGLYSTLLWRLSASVGASLVGLLKTTTEDAIRQLRGKCLRIDEADRRQPASQSGARGWGLDAVDLTNPERTTGVPEPATQDPFLTGAINQGISEP